jgi:hypothetical protein
MMVQSTRKKNRFEDFVANEHADLPEYVHEDQDNIRKQRKKKLIDKHFRVTPEASQAFNLLVAQQYTGTGPQLGPVLIAEALNLLFEKYGMEQVA